MDGNEQHRLQVVTEALLTGDSRQYAVIRTRLQAYVAARLRGLAADIEDVVADILAALIDGLKNGRFRGRTLPEFNGYLYGIARLKILQAVERHERTPRAGNPDEHQLVADTKGRNPHQSASDHDLAHKIYAGLDTKCRELLKLRYEEGWTDQEIADLRGMSKNAVSTAISRCLQKARSIGAVRENMYQKPSDDDLRKSA